MRPKLNDRYIVACNGLSALSPNKTLASKIGEMLSYYESIHNTERSDYAKSVTRKIKKILRSNTEIGEYLNQQQKLMWCFVKFDIPRDMEWELNAQYKAMLEEKQQELAETETIGL